jgi:hypothetical protein
VRNSAQRLADAASAGSAAETRTSTVSPVEVVVGPPSHVTEA